MNDIIECPHCHKKFPVEEALRHKIREEFEREQKPLMWKKALAAADERIRGQITQDMKLLKDQLEEEVKKREESQRNELALRKERIKFEEDKKEFELTSQRKLDEERKKISEESYKKAIEENRLKEVEYQNKEKDYLKKIEELNRQMKQGSQQTQGEILELEIENILKREFPYDEVKEVPKGIKGADIQHIVKNNYGKIIGSIVWESKRTKAWSDIWINKLKQDQRAVNADLAVIVTQVLPEGTKNFSIKNEVWISNYDSILGLATLLRDSLIKIATVRLSETNKQDKKEILWNYLTGIEFKNRMDAIADVYHQMQEEMEIEKRWFTKKWAKQERNIRQVIDSISGMDGDLKGITGKSLTDPEDLIKLESVNKDLNEKT
ncbi:MAG: hypothetical protein UR68_C0028G0046 [Candidatus Roizmanbacteria bacterium GW2011_GWA2_35_19]|uniref:DUF2130 domain-containing protein n=2 Tax=Candidatus Roizmaniibacteriota TaxID=1752723 RepID=A0A0G0BQE2_9BACT|nr:MAG: hypothetical protein UR63_C0010G0042 [Candidatus Roizmanbacteria bacterium GW2011_GWC2_35_12]KKP71729.1 MAG: hypothetical protein UR68_C0028G0046 [Candidatus Roizmanbacteria bacterium GW2011_GWA2_35_19]